MTAMSEFYVYALYRDIECLGPPFYIGKGSGRRLMATILLSQTTNKHKRAVCALLIREFGTVPKMTLASGLTEKAALQLEIALIKGFGRQPLGPLVNRTDGGDGTIGMEVSEVTRAKQSVAQQGKTRTLESRALVSQRLLGRKRPPEVVAKIREAHTGMKRSAESRAKMCASQANPSSAKREKIRASLTGRKRTPESVAKTAAANRGKRWTEEQKAKLKGRVRTPEHCAALKASALRQWAEYRTHHAASFDGSSPAGSLNASPSPPSAGMPVSSLPGPEAVPGVGSVPNGTMFPA